MYNNQFHTLDLSKYVFLVTGGAGFIGSNIVEYLLKYNAGHVRVLDNLSNGYIENIQKFRSHKNFEFINGDIRDFETCKRAFDSVNYATHQAALGSVPRSIKDPILTNSVNISGFLNILTAAKEQTTLRRLVYAASSSTYGNHSGLPKKEEIIGKPLSPYAITKYVNELYADIYSSTYGFHSIGLRYFNVFGPNQSPDNPYAAVIPLFLKAAMNRSIPIIYGDGETSRDFTFVENAVQANIKAMLNSENLKSHEVINIACGNRTSLNELWALICEIKKINISPQYHSQRSGDIRHSLASITKAGDIIGYKPTIMIKEGLEITLREQYGK